MSHNPAEFVFGFGSAIQNRSSLEKDTIDPTVGNKNPFQTSITASLPELEFTDAKPILLVLSFFAI